MKLKDFSINVNFNVEISHLLAVIHKMVNESWSDALCVPEKEFTPLLDMDQIIKEREDDFKRLTITQFSNLLSEVNLLMKKKDNPDPNKESHMYKDYIKFNNKSKLVQIFVDNWMTKERKSNKNKRRLLFSDIFTCENLKRFIKDDLDSQIILVEFIYDYFIEKGIVKTNSLNWKEMIKVALTNSTYDDSFEDAVFANFHNISEISILLDYPYFRQSNLLGKGTCYNSGSNINRMYEENTNIFSFPFSYLRVPIYEMSKLRRGTYKDGSLNAVENENYLWENETVYNHRYESYIHARFKDNKNYQYYNIINDLSALGNQEKIEEMFEFAYQVFITRIEELTKKKNVYEKAKYYVDNVFFKRIVRVKNSLSNESDSLYITNDLSMGYFRNFNFFPSKDKVDEDNPKIIEIPKSISNKLRRSDLENSNKDMKTASINDSTIQRSIIQALFQYELDKDDYFIDGVSVDHIIDGMMNERNHHPVITNAFEWLNVIKERILNEDPKILMKIIYYIDSYNIIESFNTNDLLINNFFFDDNFANNTKYKKCVLNARMKYDDFMNKTVANFDVKLKRFRQIMDEEKEKI